MKENLQNEFRSELERKYQLYAFEALALSTYWNNRYQETEKGIKSYEKRIEDSSRTIKELLERPDHHSVQVRNLIKSHEKDVKTFQDIIGDQNKGMVKVLKAFQDKIMQHQQNASETLDQVDIIREFKLNTPEQIAENKAKKTVQGAPDEIKS